MSPGPKGAGAPGASAPASRREATSSYQRAIPYAVLGLAVLLLLLLLFLLFLRGGGGGTSGWLVGEGGGRGAGGGAVSPGSGGGGGAAAGASANEDAEGEAEGSEDAEAEQQTETEGEVTPEESSGGPEGNEPTLLVHAHQEGEPITSGEEATVAEAAIAQAGSGPGFQGIYKGRSGGARGRLLQRGGGTPEVLEAVEAGLAWLARVQEADGHWDAAKWGGGADPTNCGVTGLALLCFLGAGHTDQEGKYKETVRRGLNWLAEVQRPDGHFGRGGRFYEQGICTMAVSEAFAMSGGSRLRQVGQKAIGRIIKVQPPSGGFDYQGRGQVDVSVTGWQIMAIKSAETAKLTVPAEAVRRCEHFLKYATYPDGRMGYRATDHRSRPSGPTPSMTAVGAVCRRFLGHSSSDPLLIEACHHIRETGVQLGDLYYTYYGTLAQFMMGPKSREWQEWNRGFRDPLLKLQVRDGPLAGSWNPKGHKWGQAGGRIYTTAMALLSLEVYWRFLPVYRASGP